MAAHDALDRQLDDARHSQRITPGVPAGQVDVRLLDDGRVAVTASRVIPGPGGSTVETVTVAVDRSCAEDLLAALDRAVDQVDPGGCADQRCRAVNESFGRRHRCILPVGHDGDHQCGDAPGPVTWWP